MSYRDPRRAISRKIRKALEDTGLPWEVTKGTKHFRVFLDGKQIAIIPMNGGSESSGNVISVLVRIRRYAEEHQSRCGTDIP